MQRIFNSVGRLNTQRVFSCTPLRSFASPQPNPFDKSVKTSLSHDGQDLQYYKLPSLNDSRIDNLPYSIRVLLESAVRNCDDFNVKEADVEKILDWVDSSQNDVEIPFRPARVIL